jgi:hypothetical protein
MHVSCRGHPLFREKYKTDWVLRIQQTTFVTYKHLVAVLQAKCEYPMHVLRNMVGVEPGG